MLTKRVNKRVNDEEEERDEDRLFLFSLCKDFKKILESGLDHFKLDAKGEKNILPNIICEECNINMNN